MRYRKLEPLGDLLVVWRKSCCGRSAVNYWRWRTVSCAMRRGAVGRLMMLHELYSWFSFRYVYE
jgi:hypothetical protein